MAGNVDLRSMLVAVGTYGCENMRLITFPWWSIDGMEFQCFIRNHNCYFPHKLHLFHMHVQIIVEDFSSAYESTCPRCYYTMGIFRLLHKSSNNDFLYLIRLSHHILPAASFIQRHRRCQRHIFYVVEIEFHLTIQSIIRHERNIWRCIS